LSPIRAVLSALRCRSNRLGEDVFLGSKGNDLITGGDGDDTALMGAGDDVFVWNPGDDDDTLEGQAGFAETLFNGANVAENIDIAANGGRVLFFVMSPTCGWTRTTSRRSPSTRSAAPTTRSSTICPAPT
jgi:Ca2+-binding RTX toxin-like protein